MNNDKIKQLFESIKDMWGGYPFKDDTDPKKIHKLWNDSFDGYTLAKLEDALDNLYTWKGLKTPPTIRQIKAVLKKQDEIILEKKNSVPAELTKQYKEAKKWYDLKVAQTSWWHEQGYVFWYQDLSYAYQEAVKEDMKLNTEKYNNYSHNGQKKLSNEIRLALFIQNKDYEGLFFKFLPKDKDKKELYTHDSLKNVIKNSLKKIDTRKDDYVPDF